MNRLYNLPAVALDKETKGVIHRWGVGGMSHWIVGDSKIIDGVTYVLVDIVLTAGVNYLICKRYNGTASRGTD